SRAPLMLFGGGLRGICFRRGIGRSFGRLGGGSRGCRGFRGRRGRGRRRGHYGNRLGNGLAGFLHVRLVVLDRVLLGRSLVGLGLLRGRGILRLLLLCGGLALLVERTL